MDPRALYGLLKLRSDVFVVEQECAFLDPDGRDCEAETRMLWGELDGEVVATLRILRDAAELRIGRVAVLQSQRGTGIAQSMMRYALGVCAELDPVLDIVLDAQAPLEGWYGTFGFVRDGETFLEDGIPHVPMRRAAAA